MRLDGLVDAPGMLLPMADKLQKFTLGKNEAKGRWDLVSDSTKRAVKSFATKADATRGGALERAVGRGSVKIQKANGRIQEERTYPRSADPRKSRG